MTLKNRVQPTGEITSTPMRGTMTGNRGILHVADRVMGAALWKHRAWICCTLDWQGRRRDVMTGRKWTELFFLDEAVALAAGHRPCAYCRRAAYTDWADTWASAHGRARAPDMDAVLHAARAVPGARAMRRGHCDDANALPDGAFIILDDRPHLIHEGAARAYSDGGYGPPRPLQRQAVPLLTPAPTVDVLRAGFAPQLHPSLG